MVIALTTGCGATMPATAPAPPVTGPAADGEPTEADVNAWLDGLVPAALETEGIAGAAVSVVHDGEILTSRGYGNSDTGVGYEYEETAAGDIVTTPVDPDLDLFRAGSVTKPFTATAVMRLVEAGELDLDTDVNEYVDFTLNTSFDEPVTLRHLLTHTAGYEEVIAALVLPDGTEPDLRAAVADAPPEQVYEPGTVPAYSNYGYALAGYVVERTSGVSYEEYVDENVLAPLGMDSSTTRQPLPDDPSLSLSHGYATDDGRPQDFEIVAGAPAGSLSTTATDMARFMLAHLDAGGEDGPSVLSPETLDLMHAPALDEDTLGGLAEGPRMTLGFFEEDRNGHRIIGHGGDTSFFHTHMQIYPEDDTGIFISLNSGGHEKTSTLQLREAVMFGFADRYFPEQEQEEPLPAGGEVSEGPERRAHAVAGSYNGSRSTPSTFLKALDVFRETEVTVRMDLSILVSPGPETGRPTAYEEIEPWVWREVEGQRILTARVAQGEVEALGHGPAGALLPVEPQRSATIALPVLFLSVGVLVLALLSWSIGALTRWHLSLPGRDRTGRLARAATRVAVGATMAACAGWVLAIMTIMDLRDVSPLTLRAIQVAQAVGVLGVVPAAMVVLADVRRRAGWLRCAGGVLVLAALAGCAWFAVSFNLLVPDISY
ncbi:serine hydrolase domain-containing protein [Nocardiopsis sp. NPDC006832]|uniref:serine hydrolase domain-containing protein n=1 Tax=Nocardiopsis sp. NPDC006832 TaxID=3157188 RepID=UPI0033EB49F2